MKKMKYILLVMMTLVLLVTAGCDPNNEKGAVNGSSASVSGNGAVPAGSAAVSSADKKETAKELNIKVYYPDDQGLKLIAVKRTIKTDAAGKYAAAIKSLLTGTKQKGQTTIIPKQAKLKSVKVKGDTAYVDFSQDLVKHFTGGSTGEEMLVGSVVNTLTEFPEIKKVQILIEGNKVETLGGHVDLTMPIERMSSLVK
ncbi:MAG: spore gernimation protein [Selenomonas ruminantium]|nr:spore gernimation protein [Selenomonas ruminantium]